jgi:hypothetical protein
MVSLKIVIRIGSKTGTGLQYYVFDVALQHYLRVLVPQRHQVRLYKGRNRRKLRKPGKASYPVIIAVFIGILIALIHLFRICHLSARNGCVLITLATFLCVIHSHRRVQDLTIST